jgi:hypothetical protein
LWWDPVTLANNTCLFLGEEFGTTSVTETSDHLWPFFAATRIFNFHQCNRVLCLHTGLLYPSQRLSIIGTCVSSVLELFGMVRRYTTVKGFVLFLPTIFHKLDSRVWDSAACNWLVHLPWIVPSILPPAGLSGLLGQTTE